MKYANANDVLPKELLSMIQNYYQGGYLYIPKQNWEMKRQTDYKIELEKRNQLIYLKHLEGRTNKQLGDIYHLSEPSIRRIITKEKARYQNMKEIIEQILPLWGIENQQTVQIYPSAWEINHSYVIKVYEDKKQLERNIKISEILLECAIPVAKTVLTKKGEKFVAYQTLPCFTSQSIDKNIYFLMSEKLQGSNISNIKNNGQHASQTVLMFNNGQHASANCPYVNKTIAWKMGCAIAQLHRAFLKCEKEVEFWDNSLLQELHGWIRENLANNEWKIISEEEFSNTVELLESVYDHLPKQLIHRDVHFGNFLFSEGNLSGYIDFDLSQRNIRIFDICYFLTGLLAEETDDAFTKTEWLENAKAVISGYESIMTLSEKEKSAIPWVMECIEILFVAYFIGMNDSKHANDAYRVFRFLQDCENDMKDAF